MPIALSHSVMEYVACPIVCCLSRRVASSETFSSFPSRSSCTTATLRSVNEATICTSIWLMRASWEATSLAAVAEAGPGDIAPSWASDVGDALLTMKPAEASSSLAAMLSELDARCPTIRPSVVPNGFADAERGVALLGLCRDDNERQALGALLSGARKRAGGRCAITDQPADESTLRFVSQWKLQPDTHAYRLVRCAFASADAALLLDTTAMLERFTRGGADAKELTRLARVFCDANRRTLASDGDAGLEARLWLQECLTLAHACQVVASNMPAWRVEGPDGDALGEAGSPVALATRVLGGADAPSNGGCSSHRGSAAKKPKGRQAVASPAVAEEEEEQEEEDDADAAETAPKTKGRTSGGAASKKRRARA